MSPVDSEEGILIIKGKKNSKKKKKGKGKERK